MKTVFVEMKGPGARALLEGVKGELERNADCEAARLLESEDEAGLLLLVIDWRGASLPALAKAALPKTAKLWRFRQAR